MFRLPLIVLVGCLAVATAAGCVSVRLHRKSCVVSAVPPFPLREDIPAPREGYVWNAGHWESMGGKWQWHEGVWLRARGTQYVWRDGYWIRHGDRYHWVDGRWEPREQHAQTTTH